MHMAKNSASRWLASAMPSSMEAKRAPTPVKEMTPTMMPAQAHTAISGIAMRAPSERALSSALGPIQCGVNQETTAALTIARVPARITE